MVFKGASCRRDDEAYRALSSFRTPATSGNGADNVTAERIGYIPRSHFELSNTYVPFDSLRNLIAASSNSSLPAAMPAIVGVSELMSTTTRPF